MSTEEVSRAVQNFSISNVCEVAREAGSQEGVNEAVEIEDALYQKCQLKCVLIMAE